MLALATRLRGGADKGWTTLMALSLPLYLAFEREVWRIFGERIRQRQFDVVHRITPVSPTMPSLIAPRCARAGVPFVLGPLNGGLPWPPAVCRAAPCRARMAVLPARRPSPGPVLPGHAGAVRGAILVGSLDTFRHLPRALRREMHLSSGERHRSGSLSAGRHRAGTSRTAATARSGRCSSAGWSPTRAVPWRSRPWRRCSARGVPPSPSSATAPTDRRWRRWWPDCSVGAGVVFAGRVPPDEVARHYRTADVLVFPSVREFGGGVVLEAMAMGTVPIVVDYGGPGELVNAECGVAVPIGRRSEIVAGVRAAVCRLLDEPDRRRCHGRGGTAPTREVAVHLAPQGRADRAGLRLGAGPTADEAGLPFPSAARGDLPAA